MRMTFAIAVALLQLAPADAASAKTTKLQLAAVASGTTDAVAPKRGKPKRKPKVEYLRAVPYR